MKSGVIIRVTLLTTHIGELITLITSTHEPPSKNSQEGPQSLELGCRMISVLVALGFHKGLGLRVGIHKDTCSNFLCSTLA